MTYVVSSSVQFCISDSFYLHVFGQCEETKAPEGKPLKQGNVETIKLHIKRILSIRSGNRPRDLLAVRSQCYPPC